MLNLTSRLAEFQHADTIVMIAQQGGVAARATPYQQAAVDDGIAMALFVLIGIAIMVYAGYRGWLLPPAEPPEITEAEARVREKQRLLRLEQAEFAVERERHMLRIKKTLLTRAISPPDRPREEA